MIKIRIISPGKLKDTWLEEAIQEYLKRMTPYAAIELVWTKDEKSFSKLIQSEKNLIYLDPKGKEMTSEQFTAYFFKQVELGGSSLSFAIGGPDGFPKGITEGKALLSLSKMTFTHQMSRLLLVEQLFRAFEIQRGSDYHR